MHFDASGGRTDAAALAVAHRDGDAVVLDVLRRWPAPHNPEAVIAEAAGVLRTLNLYRVQIDRYGGESPINAFERHGVSAEAARRATAEHYPELLPLVNAGRLRLLDHADLLRELRGLRGAEAPVEETRLGIHAEGTTTARPPWPASSPCWPVRAIQRTGASRSGAAYRSESADLAARSTAVDSLRYAMKTRWEFKFNAWGTFLRSKHRAVGKATPHGQAAGAVSVDYEALLVPDEECAPEGPHQTGKLVVTIPGGPEGTEGLAYAIALEVRERMSFMDARMEFLGLVFAERLPETPEEGAEVGDAPFFVRMTFEEAPHVPEFDAARFSELHLGPDSSPLLRQFNAARRLENPVDRYLALFKVLEKSYARGRGGNLLKVLRTSDALYDIASAVMTSPTPPGTPIGREMFNVVLETLVRIRDNCAHLRGKTGYDPCDPRIKTEVEPHVRLVEELARRCIESHTALGKAGA